MNYICSLFCMQIVNNEFKKDALLAILKASAPSEALAKLTKIVDECEATSFKHEHGKRNKAN